MEGCSFAPFFDCATPGSPGFSVFPDVLPITDYPGSILQTKPQPEPTHYPMTKLPQSELSPWIIGLRGKCPHCARGNLFGGFLSLNSGCGVCGLDFSFADSADGPAIFIIFIVGAIVVALALWVDVMFKPSMLVHLALWIPTTIILAVLLMRPFKGIIIAMQYRLSAREGKSE